jgi:hypothetical protein
MGREMAVDPVDLESVAMHEIGHVVGLDTHCHPRISCARTSTSGKGRWSSPPTMSWASSFCTALTQTSGMSRLSCAPWPRHDTSTSVRIRSWLASSSVSLVCAVLVVLVMHLEKNPTKKDDAPTVTRGDWRSTRQLGCRSVCRPSVASNPLPTHHHPFAISPPTPRSSPRPQAQAQRWAAPLFASKGK